MWIKFLVKLISLLHDDDIDDTDYNGNATVACVRFKVFSQIFIIHTTSLFSNETEHHTAFFLLCQLQWCNFFFFWVIVYPHLGALCCFNIKIIILMTLAFRIKFSTPFHTFIYLLGELQIHSHAARMRKSWVKIIHKGILQKYIKD